MSNISETAALAANMVMRKLSGGAGGVDVEMNMDEYGFTIGNMIIEAFMGSGSTTATHGNVGTFWSDLHSKNPWPVCAIEVPDFGTYKGTPICMSEDMVAFKMEVVYEAYRLSIDAIITRDAEHPEGALVFVYVNTSNLVPQG